MFAKFPGNFKKICLGNMFFWYSMFLFMPIMPIYYHSIGLSRDEIGIAVGSLSAGSLFLRFLSGRAVDKYGTKKVIRVGFCVSAVVITGYLFADSLYSAVLVRFLHGAGLSGYSAAALIGTTYLVPADQTMSAIALFTLFSQIGIGMASSMALWMYGAGGFSAIVGVGVFVTLLMLFFYPDIPMLERGQPSKSKGSLADMFRDKYIILPTLSLFFTHSSYSAIMTFLPVHLVSGNIPGAPYFYIAYAVSIVVTRFFVTAICERIPPHKMVLHVILVFALEIFIVAHFHQLPFLILSGLLLGIVFGFAFPVLSSFISSHAEPSLRGAAFGFFNTGNDIGQIFGSVALGFCIEWFGYERSFTYLGLLLICYAALYARFFMKRLT